jgi:hypothetical protein
MFKLAEDEDMNSSSYSGYRPGKCRRAYAENTDGTPGARLQRDENRMAFDVTTRYDSAPSKDTAQFQMADRTLL